MVIGVRGWVSVVAAFPMLVALAGPAASLSTVPSLDTGFGVSGQVRRCTALAKPPRGFDQFQFNDVVTEDHLIYTAGVAV